jgi:hypothetical protein
VKPETAPEGVVGIAAAGKNVIMGKVGQNLLDLAKKKKSGARGDSDEFIRKLFRFYLGSPIGLLDRA